MLNNPSEWIQFSTSSSGSLELVITQEVWEILHAAAHGEGSLWVENGSVRIDLKKLVGKGIISIDGFPPSQNPPCQHTFKVTLIP